MDDLKANAPGQAESPSALPPGYRARPATWDDLGAAVELFNACEIAEHGEPDYEENDVREEWDGLEDQQHVTLIEAPDGDLAGSLMLDKRSDTLFEAYGYVHPAHSGRGIGRWILATSEARARELTPDSAEGPTIVRNFIAGINEQANELLRVRGYTAVRKFWRMEIELTEPPDPVSWPAGFSLRDAVPGHDEPGIFAVLDESFGEHWGGNHRDYDQWLRSLSGEASTPRLWLQVFYEGKRVAIGTGKISAGTGWIAHIGVLKPYRRQGVGDALLRTLFARYWEIGIHRIHLGVDTENATGAVALYERAGMAATRTFVTYEKTLAP